MRFNLLSRLGIAGSLAVSVGLVGLAPALTKPPIAPVRPEDDTYFGQTITDPYRWLEDQKSDESKQWMKAQADYTRSVLDELPGRKAFEGEMKRYMNAADFTISDVLVAGHFVFYRKRLRGEDQASLYVRKASGGAEHRVFNLPAISTPGHHISLDQYTPSRDGKLVLVGLSAGGSEEQTAHVYESETGRELPDQMERFEGGSFSPDGKAIYFMQLEKPGPTSAPVDKYRHPQTT